jgi:hypothetical protein
MNNLHEMRRNFYRREHGMNIGNYENSRRYYGVNNESNNEVNNEVNNDDVYNTLKIPKNSINAVMQNEIEEGNIIVDFHNESRMGRYYKKNTYKKLKKNPYTRRNITKNNIKYYKTKLVGGKSKRGTKKFRKQ